MNESQKYILKEKIYDFIDGQTDVSELPEDIRGKVINEFEVGSRCDCLYDAIYAAEIRILNRLGVDDDEDLEKIMRNHAAIAKILGMKMFDYGAEFSE